MTDLVVKDNSLINASYTLSLVEQRLILLAIVAARESNLNLQSKHKLLVTADSYAKQFNVVRQATYLALKEACENLFERRFSFEERNGKVKQVKSRWVSRIAYIEEHAEVEIVFADDVIPLITELEARFTQYELKQISGLSSAYAIRLYELLIAWRSTGKTPEIPNHELRDKLGVTPDIYQRIESFKRRVLDSAITQINEHTDIIVSYEQHKKGRVITGFSFSFKFKKAPKAEKQKALASPKAQDLDAEKREAYAQFVGYQQRAQLLNEPIENLLTKKELAQFRKFEFMK